MQKSKWLYLAIGLVAFVFMSWFFTLNQNIDSTFKRLDEALIRIPIPPYPERDDNEEGEDVVLNTEEEQSNVFDSISTNPEIENETKYKRDLPGTEFVETTVTDPTIDCREGNTKQKIECYGGYLTSTVQHQSIAEAFIKLKEMYNDGDSFTISNCHQLTHVIGRASTLVFPTIAEAYNYGDTLCWSGYYHGIMEAIIAQIGLEEVPKRINQICDTLPGKESYSFDYFNCVHGLGHGMMYVEAHDLFKALKLCDLLEGRWEESSCYGGVFMENVIANEIDHVSIFLREDDLLYPCNAVDEKYKEQCYLMHTSHMLKVNGYDFTKTFEQCQMADVGFENICYQSLGRDASGFSSSDREVTTERCLLGSTFEAESNCITGAVKDFVSYFHSDVEARAFCEALPEVHKQSCLDTMEVYYRVF